MLTSKRLFAAFLFLIVSSASIPAHAWGCEGHQIVALIAMRHLQPQTLQKIESILNASPVSASVHRYCRNSGLPIMANVATWADDVRSDMPDTGAYHFIDIPLSATRGKYDIAPLCQQDKCIVDALAKYTQALKTNNDPKTRAEALRFVIHLLGDIHQPMHDSNNGDRGGNCVPVGYEDEQTRETNAQRADYYPNLHAVWDTDLLESMLAQHDMTIEEYAEYLDQRYRPRQAGWQSGQPIDWAWEGHDLAIAAYRALPANVPRDATVEVPSCADNNHVSTRMADLHMHLGERYDDATRPIVEEQLTKAGLRLAALLNSTL